MKTTRSFRTILLTLLAAVLTALPAAAQTERITCSRDINADRFESLDGGYGLLIISPHKDLVVNVVSSSERPTIRQNGRNERGDYEYFVIMSPTDTHRPKVEVSRRGSIDKTEFVQALKPDFMIAYRVEGVTNPIIKDEQTTATDVLFSATEAELEFSTTIANLQVACSPKLGAKITQKTSKADNNVIITSVVVPLAMLQETHDYIDTLAAKYTALDKKVKQKMEHGIDVDTLDLDSLDELVRLQNEAAALYSELTYVDVYGEGTNHLTIDISDLGPRMKKCYAVLPMVVEKEIFVTECNAFMNEGGKLFAQRKYEDARAAYMNALMAKDVVLNMKPTINQMISDCDSCIEYNKYSVLAIKKYNELKRGGTATQQEVARYAGAAINYLQILNNLNPDEFYTSRIEVLQKVMENMPLMYRFTVVEWKTLHEGNPMPGVELWAYYGTDQISSLTFVTDRKFRKHLDAHKQDYVQVGRTDTNGKAEIELNRQHLPTGIIFRPTADKDVKIKYLGWGELERQARGTYMEKQFRLKMYSK